MEQNNIYRKFISVLNTRPQAFARIYGSTQHSSLKVLVRFYQTAYGVLVSAEAYGLPELGESCKNAVLGFHIHSGESCTGNESDAFSDALTHYNPENCLHPYHVGDMPPLFGSEGKAFSVFLTNRFTVREIIGKTVIIHSGADDFTTQPGGNSGEKIACGKIVANKI